LGNKFKLLLTKRLELTTFSMFTYKILFINNYVTLFYKNLIKTINIIFSQINSVNSITYNLKKLNILRKYLNRTYQGYCHVLGKPVRGQRTWSNSWNSFKCNNILRNFLNKIKTLKSLSKNNLPTKYDYIRVKKKYVSRTTNKSASIGKLDSFSNKNNFLPTKSWY